MTSDDDRLAAKLAEQAGILLLELRAEGGDPADLRKAGDRLSHEFLAAELAERRPGDAVLSEEGRDNRARLTADRVWIVDPLDGTREFGEPGRTDWAVHVALWEHGALTAGAVALPAQGQVLATTAPPVVPPANGSAGQLRVVVSRTRPPAFLERLDDTVAELFELWDQRYGTRYQRSPEYPDEPSRPRAMHRAGRKGLRGAGVAEDPWVQRVSGPPRTD